MSTPRRPSASRSPAGRRPAGAGARPAAARASSRPPAGPAARPTVARAAGAGSRRRPVRAARLSLGRVAVLVLVVVTLLVSAALPVREFFRQRGQIAELAQGNAEARARVAELEAERVRQQNPAHVMAEARRRLHFVLPGETMYVVLEPTPPPADEAGDDAPWWSQLWGSVAAADRHQTPVGAPAPVPDPALVPAAPAASAPAPAPTPGP